ncbi:helix-turn-helix domain-containing protein, partial [Ilumatobacter sp.]|uniref:helix-turn-helix domain-containing protein n=1 Tax=Ilumatobacter sp. TaxID=1967498 RepID=UPI003C3EF31B
MTAELQIQARALGDPTRYELFRHVADSGGQVGVAELTELKGFNHNAIRQHLSKLVDAGLLEESTAPSSGRGRPRLLYSVHPSADSRWDVTGPYERLSLLLSEVIRTGDTPVEVGRRAGARGFDGATAMGVASDPLAAMASEMARAGFEPRIEH